MGGGVGGGVEEGVDGGVSRVCGMLSPLSPSSNTGDGGRGGKALAPAYPPTRLQRHQRFRERSLGQDILVHVVPKVDLEDGAQHGVNNL